MTTGRKDDFTMELEDIVNKIVEAEWPMFHLVNGDNRAGCQEDHDGFFALRKAQFRAWSPEAAASYLRDLQAAQREGRNLAREKYIHMMKTTDPAGYRAFCGELPPVSAEKERLAAEIWSHLLEQTERMRAKYPGLALGGRPLHARDAQRGDTSLETYQVGELLTYSEETLSALLAHIETLAAQGTDLAFEIQQNTLACNGYRSIAEAEQAMIRAYSKYQAQKP
jgi:hypothetical protein